MESISWSHEPKVFKASIFHESLIPKYDKFRIIRAGDVCLSICPELNLWDWSMKEIIAPNILACFEVRCYIINMKIIKTYCIYRFCKCTIVVVLALRAQHRTWLSILFHKTLFFFLNSNPDIYIYIYIYIYKLQASWILPFILLHLWLSCSLVYHVFLYLHLINYWECNETSS